MPWGVEELPLLYSSPKAQNMNTAVSQGLHMQSTKVAGQNKGVYRQGQLEHQTTGKTMES